MGRKKSQPKDAGWSEPTKKSGQSLKYTAAIAVVAVGCCIALYMNQDPGRVNRIGKIRSPAVEVPVDENDVGSRSTLLMNLGKAIGHQPFASTFVRAFVNGFLDASNDLGAARHNKGDASPSASWLRALKIMHQEKFAHYAMLDEKVTVEALAEAAGVIETAAGRRSAARFRMLRAGLGDLRTNEGDIETSADRTASMSSASEASGQDEQSFTYGSTPYPTFLQLWQRPTMQAALKSTLRAGHKVVVLGSSTGWLPLYASLTSGVPAVGYELLRFRHAAAQQVKEKHLDFDAQQLLTYVHGDAKKADISEAGIIWLTSLVWPADLVAAIHEKITEEAAEGAVIVSNTDLPDLFRLGIFERLDKVALPVSWGTDQTFVVYRYVSSNRVKKEISDDPHSKSTKQPSPKRRDTPVGAASALEAVLKNTWAHLAIGQLGRTLAGDEGTLNQHSVTETKDNIVADALGGIVAEYRRTLPGAEEQDAEDRMERTAESLRELCTDQMLYLYVKQDVYASKVKQMLEEYAPMRECFELLHMKNATEAYSIVVQDVKRKIESGFFD